MKAKADFSWPVIVAGGGASGLTAAIAAAQAGARTLLLEKNARVGKKILATGNGRCNYTNQRVSVQDYYGQQPDFVQGAFTVLSPAATVEWFKTLGIEPRLEEDGKIFPRSEQASSVLDVLRYECLNLGVDIQCEAEARSISVDRQLLQVKMADGHAYHAQTVVLATGGKACPASGSNGSGYRLAAALGHTITPVFPSLVQLMLAGNTHKSLAGVKVNGRAELWSGERMLLSDRGDLLFTDYGISGPPILQLSRPAGACLQAGGQPRLKLVLVEDRDYSSLFHFLKQRFQYSHNKEVTASLIGFIHKRLIPPLLQAAGLEYRNRPASSLNPKEIAAVARVLTGWEFTVKGSKGWNSAQTTAGGVATAEVDPHTMASRLVPGLFLAGELLDIDGRCGGFNLQWAWSSGWAAGYNAAVYAQAKAGGAHAARN